MKQFLVFSLTILMFWGCQDTAETGYLGQQFLLKADVPY